MMPVINTGRNQVVAYEPGPDDLFVKVVWHGPGEDGRYRHQFDGPLLPLLDYQAAVDWAVSMAEQMRFPLHVVPRNGVDVVCSAEVREGIANLSDQERGELRRFVVTRLAEVMRDSGDAAIRADAYALLSDLGMVRP